MFSCVLGGIRNSESCVLGGIRNSESSHCCVLGGIRNPESSSVFIGGSQILNLHFFMGEPLEKRNSKDHLGSNAWLRHSNEV